jgi:UDP-N-acetylmuramate dehydrogenase
MASWRRLIETSITDRATKIYWGESLSNHTTFRIGGQAECFIVANTVDDLKTILVIAKRQNIPLFILGNGSNLLISDQELTGITVKLGKAFSYCMIEHNNLRIGAATPLSQILAYSIDKSISGLEFLLGIPGTFGGAIASNAGAFSQNIGDQVIKINGLLPDGQDVSIDRNKLHFDYRKTTLPLGFIITEGILQIVSNRSKAIIQLIAEYRKKRTQTQPAGASAGSVFKNPKLVSAGKLIDDNNLKGLCNGNAYISRKHGNFILNRCNASFINVYELLQIIKSTVEFNTGTILEEEIQVLPKSQEVKKWQNQKNFSG